MIAYERGGSWWKTYVGKILEDCRNKRNNFLEGTQKIDKVILKKVYIYKKDLSKEVSFWARIALASRPKADCRG